MAFTLKGILHRKGQIDTRSTEAGSFSRQEIVLKIRRFDSMTGEEMKANYVVLEASTPALIYQLGQLALGTPVECTFFPVGTEYKDKVSGELKYFSRDRLTAIKVLQQRRDTGAQSYAPQNIPAPTAADEPQPQADDLPFE